MLLCAAAPHKALSGPVDFGNRALGSNSRRVAGRFSAA